MAYQMEGHDTREFWNAFHVLTRDLITADSDEEAYANAKMLSDWMQIWGIDRPTRKRCIRNQLASYREEKIIRRWSL